MIESFTESPGVDDELAACLIERGSVIVGDACHRAMAGFCSEQGLHGGYGPRAGDDDAFVFDCAREKQPWSANALLPLEPSLPTDVLRAEIEFNDAGHLTFADPPLHNLLSPSLAGAVQWQVPASGLLLGGARIEPLAAGGFQAKGLWLDGDDDRVEYLIAPQPNADDFATSPWFVNLSVDPREITGIQRLLTWPDGSSLTLENGPNGQQLRLAWAGGCAPPIALNNPLIQLANSSWTTVAILSEPNCINCTSPFLTDVTVFVDGMPIATFNDLDQHFRLDAGLMIVGAEAGGFRGWIDDFKVIGARPSLEEVCNHAGGTLVGIHNQSDTDLIALGAAYPAATHTRIRDEILSLGLSPGHTQHACEKANSSAGESVCFGKTHGAMPADCIRPVLHLLGTPLEWDQRRPDSTSNTFCLSCHTESNPSATMQPSQALVFNSELDMHFDPRRQPMQPYPLLNGVIPPNYFGPGDPTTPPLSQGEPALNNLDARTHPSLPVP